jgi:hypothetical protein
MVNRRNLGLTYAGVTFALVAAISASGWCWGTVNPFDVSVGLKQICIAIWALLRLIRFGGHLPKGGYDVQTDGRHSQTPSPTAIR